MCQKVAIYKVLISAYQEIWYPSKMKDTLTNLCVVQTVVHRYEILEQFVRIM